MLQSFASLATGLQAQPEAVEAFREEDEQAVGSERKEDDV